MHDLVYVSFHDKGRFLYLHVRLNQDEGVSTGNFVELLKVSELPTYSRCNGGGVGMNTVSGLMDCALR